MTDFARQLFGAVAVMVALACGLVGGGVGVTWAAPPVGAGVSFTVGPALLDLMAAPGATGRHELTVRNTGDRPLAATVAVEALAELPGERSAAAWLSVSPADLRLDPGATQTITVDVAVPDEIESGGRYAKVTITTETAEAADNAAAIAGQLGVGVLVTVDGAGELVRAAEVAAFAPVLEADGRIGFRALLHNAGNVHLLPRGEIAVHSAGEDALGTLELKETTPHLPGATALLASHGSLPLAPDTAYEADLTVAFTDGDEEQHVQAATAFTVDPSLAIAGASLCENLDRGPTVRLGLRNEGTVGLEPTVSLSVQTASGQLIGSVVPAEPVIAWPQETIEMTADSAPRLESGAYVLVATATYGSGRTVEQQVPFQIGGLENPIPLCGAGAAAMSDA